jgi:putative hydrolase of the HAD superfamily
MSGAVIFDLDDTLYPERRFALSGFAAVARHVEARFGLDARDAFACLRAALRRGARASALQQLAAQLGGGDRLVVDLRDVYRAHIPALRLPGAGRHALAETRRRWRVGLLTNGIPGVQRAKIAALGLEPLVDCVVCAHEVSDGKPDPAAFRVVCAALGVSPDRAVMAGDDPWCDIDGARHAGLRTIRVRRGAHRGVTAGATGPADATVGAVSAVPLAAARLLPAEVSG